MQICVPHRDAVFARGGTADEFVGQGELTFGQVVATSAARGRLAIGWRTVVDGEGEVVVNPVKSRRVTFGP